MMIVWRLRGEEYRTICIVLLVFVVLGLVSLVLAKRLAGKNVSVTTFFLVEWNVKPYVYKTNTEKLF